MPLSHTPLLRSLKVHLKASHRDWSRREFVKSALTSIGSSTLLSCCNLMRGGRQSLDEPVVILGGGISGLTAAYTLMKAGVECEIYEGSQRFGGRMFTKRNFNSEGMFCELGGELVDSNHQPLIQLCHEVGLELQSLKQDEKGMDFYHIDGRVYTDSDVVPAFAPLAVRLAADAEGLTDANGNFTAKAKALDSVSLSSYLADAGATTPAWLIAMLKVAYTCEQGTDIRHQSALNLINSINPSTKNGFELFGVSDEAWRIQGGNDTLPANVYQRIAGKVKLHPGHELKSMTAQGEKLKLTFKAGTQALRREAAHVICTLPFSIVRNIEGVTSLRLSEAKKRAIAEMGYGTGMKMMWGVKDRVWRQPVKGRSFFCNGSVLSDQPFRQVWETSRGQKGRSGIITNFIGGYPEAHWTAARFRAFPQEIQKVFPSLAGQWDGNRALMDWPKSKWMRGSYSGPRVGHYTWIYQAAATPELNGALHFAGEHTSLQSWGWMNGGVETGMRAAKEMMQA